MAMNLAELRTLVDREQIKYFVSPNASALIMLLRGRFGSYQVVLALDLQGRFLQLRTHTFFSCPDGHPHLLAVLRLLGDLNHRRRFVKYAWDAACGEITMYGDVWLMDGTITQEQLSRIFANFLPEMDTAHARLQKLLASGQDLGELESPAGFSPPAAPDGGRPIDKL